MKHAFTLARGLLFSGMLVFASTGSAFAQDRVEFVMQQLRAVQEKDDATVAELREAVANVQRIVDDFPASDAAVSILLGEPHNGIDFTSFEQRLLAATESKNVLQDADAQTNDGPRCLQTAMPDGADVNLLIAFRTDANGNLTDLPDIVEPQNRSSDVRLAYLKVAAALEECAPYERSTDGFSYRLFMTDEGDMSLIPVAPIETTSNRDERFAEDAIARPPLGTEETERLLGLDRQAVRDIQARLLVIGYDPNGIDGSIGRGTRSAIRSWQGSIGAINTGFLNALQLDALRSQSQSALAQWLQAPENASRYNPPKRASSRRNNRLRNGWYRDRNGKYCRRTRIGLIFCTPRRPPDA